VYLEPYRGLSRVKVGPFESREQARDVLSELEAAGFEGNLAPASGVPQ
jgi:cell division protein FtsN